MPKRTHISPILLLAAVSLAASGCSGGGRSGDADASQIEQALAACGVRTRDYARDRLLKGRYLIMYHPGEPDHERKMRCVTDRLQAMGVSATAIYPAPAKREGLY
jgi:sugar/nucleoside kinase (ribokinase family)